MSPSPPAEMTASDLRDRPFYCREWVFQRLQHCLEGLGGSRAPGILITGCKGDLNETFKRLVLLPLAELPPPSQNLLLLVDSVDEMCCCCRSDGFGAESSCTIAELLANHHELLPPWLLLVCTARRQNKTVTRMFTGFRRVCLDDLRKAHIVRDVQQYILCRLDREETLRQHLTLDTAEMLNQLHIKSNGCFLYLKRVLDGVSEGSILLREVRHIPGTLNGLYLWMCQRLFSGRQFCQVQTLLNVILASPSPLSPSQLHRAVWTKQMKGWSVEDFNKVLESVSSLLHPTGVPQNWLVLFHHSFSEWLLDVKYCTQKYLCSVPEGHSMLAMSLSARAPSLSPAEVQQLARHLLMSDLRGLDPSHLALWLLWTGVPVSDCLASDIPLELEVLQLLLLARSKVDGIPTVEDSRALRRTLERAGSVEMMLDGGGSLNKRDRAGRTLLAAAAHVGNLEAVILMISRGANLEATDEDGQTPLGLAAHRGHLGIIELLLEHGARHDHTDSRGWTPLRAASWGGHTEVVEALLAVGAQPDVSGRDGRTALRAAAWGGHEGPVKALLRAGARIDHADVEGRTPLMAAAYMGHRAVAELLLESGADVNKFDLEGRTALAVACLCMPAGNMYPEMVSLLLEHVADPELEDKEGVTPLLVAAYEGKEEVAELLLEAGANPDKPGKGQMTPLLAAALGGHSETVRVLLLWGATTDMMDNEGRSALLLAAAAAGGEQAVRVLMDRGLNENHQDLLGWTALHWAACEGRKNVCRTLIEGGAKLGIRDSEGNTPLLLAAQEGHTGCVELLINRGSPVDQRGSDHMTALCFAALGGHKSTVKLLLKKGADPDVKASQEKPLLYLLALQGLTDMAEILFDHGANPEVRDLEERTALHASCWQGDWEMARILLLKGKANCNAFDRERRTPLHCASWRGHVNIAHLLLENGAFVDAQCLQGATPLCISAQEGHEELAKVLLDEGKASPFHADHYGRTPIRVAAKGGHLSIVNLLEKHGVPPYKGLMGNRPEKDTIQKGVVEGSGGSWSTLSPVSTGSQSLDNSLKSSKGSILTSSTYHSQATVPADSLTFTQQVQQHSLPRSRSRQALALTGVLSGQVLSELKLAQVSPASTLDQTSSPHHDRDRSEVVGVLSRNPSSPDRELKRNGILTNPKYGSPTYSRFKAGDCIFSPNRTSSPKSYNRPTDPEDDQNKISSSGYSSSQAGTERDRTYKQTADSAENTKNVTQFPTKTGKPATSPQKIGTSGYSPWKSSPMTPSTKTMEPVYPLKKTPNQVSPPQKCEDPIYFAKKPVDFVFSPMGAPDGASSPVGTATEPQYCTTTDQTGSPSPLNSPVISMTTMDPQLHLKQVIKLQFEGRTCGFNFRKETPL
ncbi:PREDICTED: ankyrin repeat domain-containing protein 50-like [Nanorana parkeri]|uniref:ankyrin repeat domain-containing protein 50-like n=1 Tax=Nanorana parkeri TaxID=125878 RepID=UPI0008544212|nr:PREDICTED: ankyrin repeat domain-containing protein 50-like [Nanorana parkeri]